MFGIVACADFGPSLLAPGRIEHLLSLPVRRHELLLGTFLGVLALSLIGAVYGAGGFTLLFAIKTGVWTARPIAGALLASVHTFAGILRGDAHDLGGRAGARALRGGGRGAVRTGHHRGLPRQVDTLFESGAARESFRAVTYVLPRVSALADASADIAASATVKFDVLGSQVLGLLVFGFSALALGIHLFEQKDF